MDPTPKLKSKNPLIFSTGPPPGIAMLWPPALLLERFVSGSGAAGGAGSKGGGTGAVSTGGAASRGAFCGAAC